VGHDRTGEHRLELTPVASDFALERGDSSVACADRRLVALHGAQQLHHLVLGFGERTLPLS